MATKTALTASLTQQLFPAKISRADKRKLQILDGAIRTYAALKIDYIGYEDLARASKTSRPLVIHHFPDKRELFEMAIKLVRAQMQDLAIARLTRATTPQKQLIAYVESTFEWTEKYNLHFRTWLFFFYQCCGDEKFRRHHHELTEMGRKRIAALLEQGKSAGVFDFTDADRTAKAIQRTITGGLMEANTESVDPKKVQRECVRDCLLLAGHRDR